MSAVLEIIGTEPPLELAPALELIGLHLVASMERRDCCDVCRAFDTMFDADALAMDRHRKPHLIAWRIQEDYDYQTVTIRWSSDRGNTNVQAAKLIDGRSMADLYVQSYPSGVAWGRPALIRAALLQRSPCLKHTAEPVRGADGQYFRIVCADCAGVRYVPRRPATTTQGSGTPATITQVPTYDFGADDEFMAAWDAVEAALR